MLLRAKDAGIADVLAVRMGMAQAHHFKGQVDVVVQHTAHRPALVVSLVAMRCDVVADGHDGDERGACGLAVRLAGSGGTVIDLRGVDLGEAYAMAARVQDEGVAIVDMGHLAAKFKRELRVRERAN